MFLKRGGGGGGGFVILKIINNSSRENKENYYCDRGLDVCSYNYHKIMPTLALNFSKSY